MQTRNDQDEAINRKPEEAPATESPPANTEPVPQNVPPQPSNNGEESAEEVAIVPQEQQQGTKSNSSANTLLVYRGLTSSYGKNSEHYCHFLSWIHNQCKDTPNITQLLQTAAQKIRTVFESLAQTQVTAFPGIKEPPTNLKLVYLQRQQNSIESFLKELFFCLVQRANELKKTNAEFSIVNLVSELQKSQPKRTTVYNYHLPMVNALIEILESFDLLQKFVGDPNHATYINMFVSTIPRKEIATGFSTGKQNCFKQPVELDAPKAVTLLTCNVDMTQAYCYDPLVAQELVKPRARVHKGEIVFIGMIETIEDSLAAQFEKMTVNDKPQAQTAEKKEATTEPVADEQVQQQQNKSANDIVVAEEKKDANEPKQGKEEHQE